MKMTDLAGRMEFIAGGLFNELRRTFMEQLTDEDFELVIKNLSKMEELIEDRKENDKDQLQLNLKHN